MSRLNALFQAYVSVLNSAFFHTPLCPLKGCNPCLAWDTAYLHLMWVQFLVCGSFALNVGLFVINVGPGVLLFALNVGRKSPCLWVLPIFIVGRYS